MFRFWQSFPSRTKRVVTIVVIFLLSIIITVAGTLTPLSDEDVASLGGGLEDTQNMIGSFSGVKQTSFIFGNNFMICLVGFVPIIGPIFEGYVLYSTGIVLNAYASYSGIHVNPAVVFFSLFLFPFTWLEFLAYSTAIAESIWLTRRIIKRAGKREIRNACIFISICAVMLLIAAVIEVVLLAVL